MGALIYEPEAERGPNIPHESLDKIAEEIAEFQRENDDDKYVEDLLNLGGSSAGARPKVLMHLDGEHWLIKFPSHLDPKDIGAISLSFDGWGCRSLPAKSKIISSAQWFIFINSFR